METDSAAKPVDREQRYSLRNERLRDEIYKDYKYASGAPMRKRRKLSDRTSRKFVHSGESAASSPRSEKIDSRFSPVLKHNSKRLSQPTTTLRRKDSRRPSESRRIHNLVRKSNGAKRESLLKTLRLMGGVDDEKNTGEQSSPVGKSTDHGTLKNEMLSLEGANKTDTHQGQTESAERAGDVAKKPPSSFVSQGAKAFRRKVARKKNKGKYVAKFRRIARLILLLTRLWKIHASRVNDIIRSFSSLNIMTGDSEHSLQQSEDVLFDKRDFRADTQARVSGAAKRILQKTPSERTEKDIHAVQVALGSYESLAEYPIHIQREIASKSWYESYTSKRVITREGHVPMGYYFILSGSAIVSAIDKNSNTRKTLTILSRGDTFGESAIVSRTKRTTTVISKDKLEMFVISAKDYDSIFMAGGLQDPEDPFLKSVPFLQGWPIDVLQKNPNKTLFSFFKRSTVLVADSRKSDWLYIIKSGSVSVLKKLHHVVPEIFQRSSAKDRKTKDDTSHLTRIQQTLDRHIARANEADHYRLRHNALPQINVPATDDYHELKTNMFRSTRQDSRSNINSEKAKSVSFKLKPMDAENGDETKATPSGRELIRSRESSSLGQMLNTKGPFLVALPGASTIKTKTELPETGSKRRSSRLLPKLKMETRKGKRAEVEKSTFVIVQVLTKGSVFGMQELVYGKQPGFSLVSNGAECVLINKKFYLEHASDTLLTKLRDEVYPYPSDDDLQQSLSKHVNWNAYRSQTVRDVMRQSKLRSIDVFDSRSRLDDRVPVR